MPAGPAKQRIAVLGGGVGSLSFCYALTSQPHWKDHYEVTLYQLGWRLGGKGATGRDPQNGQRIQEHGLHLWFGFYENAFSMLRGVYRELERPPTAPLATWQQAMLPHNQYALVNKFNGQWVPWNLELPVNPNTPGDGLAFPMPWDYVIEALQLLVTIWKDFHPDFVTTVGAVPLGIAMAEALVVGTAEGILSLLVQLLAALRSNRAPAFEERLEKILVTLLTRARTLVHDHLTQAKIDSDLVTYRTWIAFDFLSTAMIGILTEDLLFSGFSKANDRNFSTWMAQYGLSQTTLDSCLVQTAYDSSFALWHVVTNPNMEAGTALKGALRMFLLYKGSISYEFAAGCGDTVFAPLYQVLKQRGVKFEFFHEVTELVADPSGSNSVAQIKLNQQAHLTVGEYDPLIDVNGLPCWPNTPRFEQLVEGAQLQAQGVNLESYWNTWQGGTPKVLNRGQDFDLVVAGMSFYPLVQTTPTLAARSPRWKEMLDRIQTTRTQGVQLWMSPTLEQLGWTLGPPLLSTFGEPLGTWADLSVVMQTENWPVGVAPKSVQYFCGAMTQGPWQVPPRSDAAYPAQQAALVKQEMINVIEQRLFALWPSAYTTDSADRAEDLPLGAAGRPAEPGGPGPPRWAVLEGQRRPLRALRAQRGRPRARAFRPTPPPSTTCTWPATTPTTASTPAAWRRGSSLA